MEEPTTRPAKSAYPGYTEARKRANHEWAKKQAQIAIRVAPELKAAIDAHIAAQGETLAGFIVRAVSEQIKRDDPSASVPAKVATKSKGGLNNV